MKRREVLGGVATGVIAGFIPWRGATAGNHRLKGYLRTNWSRDPFAMGSYSFAAKGAKRSDRRHLRDALGTRVFFAGEATDPRQHATVHAAFETGQRAAQDVLHQGQTNVAIVGAGMSGLSAAHFLAARGVRVQVFEARGRIGGRIWTDQSLGIPLDMGASWIHGTRGNPLSKLSDARNLPRIATDDSYLIRGKNGTIIADRDAPDWLENVVSIQHDAAADYSQINVWAAMQQDEYDGAEVIFPNGYAQIFGALAGNYDVHLSRPVKRISYDTTSVTLTLKTGASQRFDAVIVTVPLGVLKRETIQFDPLLPKQKREAIRRIGMGTLDKVYLQFDQVFWDKEVTWIATPENGLHRGHFNGWLNLYKYIRKPVIVGFNGGPPAIALSALSDRDIVGQAVQTLNLAYPR